MRRTYNSGLSWWRTATHLRSVWKKVMFSMLRCIISALLITVSSAALSEENCQSEKSIKSADSNKETKVQFKNESKSKIKIYWINYDGKREFYSDVNPGRSYTQDTYMTHPWVITDMTGQCVLLFRPLPGATLATVSTVD